MYNISIERLGAPLTPVLNTFNGVFDKNFFPLVFSSNLIMMDVKPSKEK